MLIDGIHPAAALPAPSLNPTGPDVLKNASAQQAAQFALTFMAARLRTCPALDRLRYGNGAASAAQQFTPASAAANESSWDRIFSTPNLVRLTDHVLRHSVDSPGVMAALAARAVVEHGYPHRVELCTFMFKLPRGQHSFMRDDTRLDHEFIHIQAAPGHSEHDGYCVDPLLGMMSATEKVDRIGHDSPAAYSVANFRSRACCLVDHRDGRTALIPAVTLRECDVTFMGYVELDGSGRLHSGAYERNST